MTKENKKAEEYLKGYKTGQKALARAILGSEVESVADLAYWLAKLKAISEAGEDSNEFVG